MKKKVVTVLSVIILIVLIIVLSAKTITIKKIDVNSPDTAQKTLATQEILMQVLNGEKEFIFNGKEITLNNLNILDVACKINQYTFVDLDGDYESELVAITDSYYDYYLVLHIENNVIYGYNISLKDIEFINKNGIILDIVDNSIYYRRLKFNKTTYKKMNVASFSSDEYMIDGEVVGEDEFNNYQEEYAKIGLVKYKSLGNDWMEKKLNSEYSMKAWKTFSVNLDCIDFAFSLDNEFDNFKNDLLDEKINLYYVDSNNNFGRVLLKRSDESYEKFSLELSNKKSVAIYDEDTQYIAVVINNDRLKSNLDNNYDIYYFKYFNKDIKFLAKHNKEDYNDLFNEDVISELE